MLWLIVMNTIMQSDGECECEHIVLLCILNMMDLKIPHP
jgi:hypothetical protein